MKNRYSIDYANLKWGGFRYSINKKKFLFNIILSNYPVPYICMVYKYCLSSTFFKSIKGYIKIINIFKKNFKKQDMVVVLTDVKNDCPRAIGLLKIQNNLIDYAYGLKNNSYVMNIIFYNNLVDLDISNKKDLSDFLWIDFYDNFSITSFKDLNL